MSKIVSMSSGAIDPIAQSKRVFWRPATPATVLKVGQPVCYHSDSIYDHKDRSKDPTHLGLTEDTYADGAQDKTARLFCVEEPLTANLNAFAGICKVLGPKAGADGDMIEIWKPNGAVLPCWIDQNVKLDETILGIRNGEADVSYPGEDYTNPGRPIGIAKETYNRSADANNGLVWVKVDPNMFSFQYGISDTAYLKMDGGHPVNKQYVEMVDTTPLIGFLQDSRLLYTAEMTAGQLTVANIYLDFKGTNSAAGQTFVRGAVCLLNLSECTLTSAGAVYAGLQAQIGGEPASFTTCLKTCALWVDAGLQTNPDGGRYSIIYVSENSTNFCDTVFDFRTPRTDYFAMFSGDMDGGAHHCIVAFTDNHDTDAADRALKCDIDGTPYYIPLFNGVGV